MALNEMVSSQLEAKSQFGRVQVPLFDDGGISRDVRTINFFVVDIPLQGGRGIRSQGSTVNVEPVTDPVTTHVGSLDDGILVR